MSPYIRFSIAGQEMHIRRSSIVAVSFLCKEATKLYRANIWCVGQQHWAVDGTEALIVMEQIDEEESNG